MKSLVSSKTILTSPVAFKEIRVLQLNFIFIYDGSNIPPKYGKNIFFFTNLRQLCNLP